MDAAMPSEFKWFGNSHGSTPYKIHRVPMRVYFTDTGMTTDLHHGTWSPMQSQRNSKNLTAWPHIWSTGLTIGANRAGPRPGPFPSSPRGRVGPGSGPTSTISGPTSPHSERIKTHWRKALQRAGQVGAVRRGSRRRQESVGTRHWMLTSHYRAALKAKIQIKNTLLPGSGPESAQNPAISRAR